MAVAAPELALSAGPAGLASDPSTPGARRARTVHQSTSRITFTYLAVAVLWVIFSDRVASALVTSPSILARVQTFKGSAFVAGSALLIYVLLRRELRGRERDQERLRRAETRYRTLVEQIPAITYINTVDETTRTLYMSPQAEVLLGFEPQEWTQDPDFWSKRLHPDDREDAYARWLGARDRGSSFSQEYRVIARDGRVVWFRDDAVVLADAEGRASLIQGVMFDITDRKAAEEERRRNDDELLHSFESLRRTDHERLLLLHRLVGAEERERRRIASDVHDGPLQLLTTVALRLGMLRDRLAGREDRETLDRLLEVVVQSTASLRALLFDLRPPTLDRDGLAAALREYLAQISLEGGFEPHIEDRLDTQPPPDVAALTYRIAREALSNARKHARAKNVTVLLVPWEGGVKVRIDDDGVGFDAGGAEEVLPGHLGLSDMRERAEMAGGWLTFGSAPGRGTTVEFWTPPSTSTDVAGHPAEGDGPVVSGISLM